MVLPLFFFAGSVASAQVIFRKNESARRDSAAPFTITRLGGQPQPGGHPAFDPEAAPLTELSDAEVAAWLDSLGTATGNRPVVSRRARWAALPHHLPLARDGGVRLSSRYGPRTHPVLGVVRHHDGIDLATPAGSPVYATADGVVETVRRSATLGLAVTLRHAHGLRTVYGHLSRCGLRAGQAVRRGQRIGAVGSTGRATGPHLHYALRQGGRFIDPLRFSALVRSHLTGAAPPEG